jgi:hypothetical protein
MSCSCISEIPVGAHFNNNADQKNQMEKLVMRLAIVHCLLQVALEPRPPPAHSLCIPTMHIQVISCRATLAAGRSTYFSSPHPMQAHLLVLTESLQICVYVFVGVSLLHKSTHTCKDSASTYAWLHKKTPINTIWPL